MQGRCKYFDLKWVAHDGTPASPQAHHTLLRPNWKKMYIYKAAQRQAHKPPPARLQVSSQAAGKTRLGASAFVSS
eukprot:scaffold191042_cov17-Tisochrysis_lutea.AAC.2